jgi:hypothetical protein
LEELYGDAITGIGRLRGFQSDYFCLGFELGNMVDLQERNGREDGEGENPSGLEGRVMIEIEKAPRQTDISNNPMSLDKFTALRI